MGNKSTLGCIIRFSNTWQRNLLSRDVPAHVSYFLLLRIEYSFHSSGEPDDVLGDDGGGVPGTQEKN